MTRRISIEKSAAALYRRLRSKPGERQPCEICGRHRAITESHHLVEVEYLVNQCVKALTHFPETAASIMYYAPTVWLCPNHHAMMHVVHFDLDALDFESDAERWAYLALREQAIQAKLENVRLLKEARSKHGLC